MSKLKVLDLFAGIGGFSLGLHRTGGFETVAFCEINEFCQKVLAKNFPNIPIFPDVRTLDYDGTVDVITSGDPCQRDSRANAKRDGQSMWPFTFEQVKKHRPIYVLRENVSGNIETGTLAKVEADLRSIGYQVRSYNLPAMAFGAPHERYRTWTMAYARSTRCKEFHHSSKSGTPPRWQHTMQASENGVYWLGAESPVLRRVDDVPHRVDRIRLTGNAVVHVVPQMIGHAILEAERAVV